MTDEELAKIDDLIRSDPASATAIEVALLDVVHAQRAHIAALREIAQLALDFPFTHPEGGIALLHAQAQAFGELRDKARALLGEQQP